MNDEQFLEKWMPLEEHFRGIEERYREDRIRVSLRTNYKGDGFKGLWVRLKEASEIYIEATTEQRKIVRDLFAWSYILPNYLPLPLDGVIYRQEELTHRLRLALASASLANNKTDFRDMFFYLGEVWVTAIKAQLDPTALFQEAASWSSDQDDLGYGGSSMRNFLLNFQKSAFFKAEVAPRL